MHCWLYIAISSIFVILPFLLLAVYPCRCFHMYMCLNHCGPRFQALHVFMDAFQGSYRTQPRDMRYFSAFYLFLRILIIAQAQIFMSSVMIFTSGILSLASAAAVVTFEPYKVKTHNTIDTVLMLLMGTYFLCYYADHLLLALGYKHQWIYIAIIEGVSVSTLFLYYVLLLAWKLLHLKVHVGPEKKSLSEVEHEYCSQRPHSNGEVIESFDRDLAIGIGNRNNSPPPSTLLGHYQENPIMIYNHTRFTI